MPDLDVELVQRFFSDETQHDLGNLLGFLDAQAEFDFLELDTPWGGRSYRGTREIEGVFREANKGWRETHFAVDNAVSGGGNVVIDGQRMTVSYAGFGTASPMLSSWISLERGKITRWKIFRSRSDALAAAGLAQGG